MTDLELRRMYLKKTETAARERYEKKLYEKQLQKNKPVSKISDEMVERLFGTITRLKD